MSPMNATLDIRPMQVPLTTTEDGVLRVGGTRVTLDTVVHAFGQGATAEEIVGRYPTLALDDGYATIAFLLRYLKTHTTWLFIAYRLALGGLILALLFFGRLQP